MMSFKLLRLVAVVLILAVLPAAPCIPKRMCKKPLSSLCRDKTYKDICADNIITAINNSLSTFKDLDVNTTSTVEIMPIEAVCKTRQSCEGATVVGFSKLSKNGTAYDLSLQLFPCAGKNVCEKNGWTGNTSLTVYYAVGKSPNRAPNSTCVWKPATNYSSSARSFSTCMGSDASCNCTSLRSSDDVTSEVTSVPKAENPVTATMTSVKTLNCSDTREAESDRRFKSSDIVLAACFSFIFGVASVLVVLVVVRMKRENKMCFKQKDVPSPAKWEGASNAVTRKVIAKYMIKKKNDDHVYEDTGTANTKGPTKVEHVYCDLDNAKHSDEGTVQFSGTTNDERKCEYENDEMESCAGQQTYFVLENDNFRVSTMTGNEQMTSDGTDSNQGLQSDAGRTTDDNGQEANMYFILEKAENTEVLQEHESNTADTTYAVLEKQ